MLQVSKDWLTSVNEVMKKLIPNGELLFEGKSMYEEQWEIEKDFFFDKLKSGDFELDGDIIFVEYAHDENCPRFI